jgi:hypothetical protein
VSLSVDICSMSSPLHTAMPGFNVSLVDICCCVTHTTNSSAFDSFHLITATMHARKKAS